MPAPRPAGGGRSAGRWLAVVMGVSSWAISEAKSRAITPVIAQLLVALKRPTPGQNDPRWAARMSRPFWLPQEGGSPGQTARQSTLPTRFAHQGPTEGATYRQRRSKRTRQHEGDELQQHRRPPCRTQHEASDGRRRSGAISLHGRGVPHTARNNVYVLRMAADVAEAAGSSPFVEARCAPEPRRHPEIAQEVECLSVRKQQQGPPRYAHSITTTHLGWDAYRWTVPFVNVHPATVVADHAVRRLPEAVSQPVKVVKIPSSVQWFKFLP